MKAYFCRRYGGPEVVELDDVQQPVPKDNEVLIRINATTVTSGDWRVRTLAMPKGFGPIARLALGVTRPRQPILGTELAGVIETVGKDVTRFRPGDEVFAFPGAKMGCHAQYRAVAEDGPVAPKPETSRSRKLRRSALADPRRCISCARRTSSPANKLLVIGASGAVGTAMVQLAKHFGAHVTGVTSTGNLELVRSLGADRVIDYTKEDFVRSGETYDVIADTVGATSFARCKAALKDEGKLLAIAGGLPDLFAALRTLMTSGRKVIAGPAEERPADVRQLAELAKAGVLRPVIDRRYDFAQMREAHAYVETRRKRGSVVVRVGYQA